LRFVRCQLLASEFHEALKRALLAPELSPVERCAVIAAANQQAALVESSHCRVPVLKSSSDGDVGEREPLTEQTLTAVRPTPPRAAT
jgi:hypothetical protein